MPQIPNRKMERTVIMPVTGTSKYADDHDDEVSILEYTY
jgi:hypothetical protein